MGKYLSLYRSILEYNNDTNRAIPNVSYINNENGNKDFYYHAKENSQFPEFPNYPGAPVNGKNYLRFRAVTDSTISMKQHENSNTVDIKYSYDGQNWTQWDYLNDTISLSKGTVVYIKGNNSSGFNTFNSGYKYFSLTGKIAAGGNIMSMLYNDDFEDKYTIPCDWCYYRMFHNCTSLTTAPELPATALDTGCYDGMFHNCSSLVTAPKLPATTLAPYCYYRMFHNCTSLTTAPDLPATTLAKYCYSAMFFDCTSLTTAPELPATALDLYCYDGMFSHCSSLVTAPKLPATTLAPYCYYSMFYGCTSLVTAPELPATKLAAGCYNSMFSGCTSLTTAPELPATTLAQYCYNGMFVDCVSLTTAPDLPATTLKEQCYSSMFSGCTSLNHIKMLATDISANNCLTNWVHNVVNNGTFIKHLNMNSLSTGYNGIPDGWNIGIEIDYKRFSIINNSNNDEIIFYHNDGIYSPIKGNHIDLSYEYDKDIIYSFTPEINLTIDIYKVSRDNIGMLGLSDVVWGSGASLEELCYTYNINDLDDILIIIKSVDNKYNGGYNDEYGYYGYYDYYNSSETGMHMYYSKDNGNTWIGDIYSHGESFTIDVNQGDIIMFKASRDENDIDINKNVGGYLTFNIKSDGYITWNADDNSGIFSNSTASFDVSGNIMSLVYGDNFEGKNQLNTSYIFNGIFSKTLVVNAENLILPATALVNSCYSSMFYNCSSLTTAPELPATTLAQYCYNSMFHSCTSLTTAPKLPATTLADYCYYHMFADCTSLTTAPELPATALEERCYSAMFLDCTSLVAAPDLPAATLANYCYSSMFRNCTSLVTAPDLPATTLVNSCYSFMFADCTSLTTAPELPATALAAGCYSAMFFDCTSLTTAPDLPAATLANYCYSSMFRNCTSLTTAPDLPATVLTIECYYYMFKSCKSLNHIKMLATDISARDCLYNWVSGVAKNGTFIKHLNMNSLPTGSSGIPEGWSVQNTSI